MSRFYLFPRAVLDGIALAAVIPRSDRVVVADLGKSQFIYIYETPSFSASDAIRQLSIAARDAARSLLLVAKQKKSLATRDISVGGNNLASARRRKKENFITLLFVSIDHICVFFFYFY